MLYNYNGILQIVCPIYIIIQNYKFLKTFCEIFSGKVKKIMSIFAEHKKIVVKVGSSTLTHKTGSLNLRRIEELTRVLSDLKNSGKEIILVTSGAVSAGIAKSGLGHRPYSLEEKQAMASIGQSELMKIYDRSFSDYGHTVAQILMTRDVVEIDRRREAAQNTFKTLLTMGCLPIVNENDAVSTDELGMFGGNDILSAHVARLIDADLLIILSDIEGLYDSDPRSNPDSKLIRRVENIDDYISCAGESGSDCGTGGMKAKFDAGRLVCEAGIPMIIASGEDPRILYGILDGQEIGTYFHAKNTNLQ